MATPNSLKFLTVRPSIFLLKLWQKSGVKTWFKSGVTTLLKTPIFGTFENVARLMGLETDK
jgi:hypothetical protein